MKNSVGLAAVVMTFCVLSACDFTPPPGYTGPNDPISIAQYNFRQKAQYQQQAEGIAVSSGIPEDQANAWARDGFVLSSPLSWADSGVFDPNVALQWISVDPNFIDDPGYQENAPEWVQPFVQAGLTPQQVKPFLAYLYKKINSEDYARITLSAWPYYQQGIPVDKAIQEEQQSEGQQEQQVGDFLNNLLKFENEHPCEAVGVNSDGTSNCVMREGVP